MSNEKRKEELLKCFSSHNKRRLLNIFKDFEMTHEDLVRVTGLNPGYIGQCLKKFVEAGIIIKRKIPGEKMVIYMRWFHNHKIVGVEDIPSWREIEMSNLQDAYNRELKRRGKESIKAKISKKKTVRKHITKNPLSEYQVNFIKQVFELFQFRDDQFTNDIDYINHNKTEMRAISYLGSYDKLMMDKIYNIY